MENKIEIEEELVEIPETPEQDSKMSGAQNGEEGKAEASDDKQVVEVKNKKGFDEKKSFKRRQKPVSEFEERVVAVKRISKTTKGGRMMRFSALVVVGNRKGVIGFGMGKSNEVPNAIKKAIKNANNNLVNIKINNRGTIYHEVWGHHGASKVLLKPAAVGKGIVAGGPVRAVVELAGFQDIYAKSLGSNTSINMIRATVDGLMKQFTPQDIAKLREKEVEDL